MPYGMPRDSAGSHGTFYGNLPKSPTFCFEEEKGKTGTSVGRHILQQAVTLCAPISLPNNHGGVFVVVHVEPRS